MLKRFLTVIIPAVIAFAAGAGEVKVDFSGKQVPLDLKNGAVIRNNILEFEKKRSFAEVPGTLDMDFTNGGTLMMTVRVFDLDKEPGKFRFFAEKRGSFLFGVTNGKFNFSLCNKGKWNIALIGGELPENNKFVHLAAVARRVYNPEQSRYGFQLEVYVNGEKILSKFNHVKEYESAKHALTRINVPERYANFNGSVASFSFTDKALTPNDVFEAAKKNPFIKIQTPGLVEVPEKINSNLKSLAGKVDSKIGKFTVAALQKAALSGVPAAKLARGISAVTAIGKSKDFVKKFNNSQKDFALLESDNGILFLSIGDCGSAFPVVDIYDPVANSGVMGRRSNSWTINYELNKKFFKLHDYSDGVKISASTPELKNGKWHFSVQWVHPVLTAKSNGVFSAEGLTMDFSATAVDREITMTNCLFPRWAFARKKGKDFLVTPYFAGKLVASPIENYSYERDFPCAQVAMQFQSYYSSNGDGVYVAMEDPHGTIRVTSVYGKGGELFAAWKNYVPYPEDGKTSSFTVDGKTAVRLFKGDWFDAAQVYKNFLKKEASWWIKDLPRQDTPEWFRNNSIWILAGVFPSRNEATMLYLREYFEQPFGVHLVGTTAKRWWPHFDRTSEIGLTRMKNLQAAGLKVLPYCDPRLYSIKHPDTFTKKTPGGVAKWNKDALNWSIKRKDNKPFIENYGVKCLVLCPQAPGWHDEYLRICAGIADNGFDGIYHDQLPCGHGETCFDTTHGHRKNDPSSWIKNGYAELYRKMRAMLEAKRPGMVHTGEDGSDPFLKMIDGYTVWRWTEPDSIPLFQTIYAGRIQFTGKLYNHQRRGDWESNFAKAASQLINAEQLGWVTLEDLEAATPFRKYYKVLAFVRKALLEYFNTADRIAPLKFTVDPGKMYTAWGNTYADGLMVDSPRVEHSCWQLPDGRKMVLFINATESSQRAEVIIPWKSKYSFICRQESAKAAVANNSNPAIVLPPYGVEVRLYSNTDNSVEADKIAAELHRTTTFDEGKTLSIKPVVKQKTPEKYTVKPGELVKLEQAAEYTNSFKRYFANGVDKDTVIIIYDNSTVKYRGMDFGDTAIGAICPVVAFDNSEVGGVIQLKIDGKAAGAVTLTKGGRYMDFQKLDIPVDLTGIHDVEFVFSGKSCRFKGFTVK